MSPTDAYPRYVQEPNTPLFANLTRGRLAQAEGGRYFQQNLTSALYKERTDVDKYVKMEVWAAPGLTKPSFEEAIKAQDYRPLKKGHKFGPSWTNHWVKVTLNIPESMADEERVQFEFDPGCEAMIFNTDGLPLQGITGGFGGDRRVEHLIDKSKRSSQYKIYIEVSANGMFGIGDSQNWGDPDPNRYFTLGSADIVSLNMPAWHLLWDFRAIRGLVDTLPENSRLRNEALVAANEILNVFKYDDWNTISDARKVAEKILGKGWFEKKDKVYDSPGRAPSVAISNCHIDTAWMWPFSVTQQKVARSWSTQCDLMDRYPEHTFTCSTAQQVKWLEQLYPKLFDRVKEKVDKGTFHMVGGSWVENDTNLPSGESLVRQFLYGQRYFKSRFGNYCNVAWLPDTFGYSSQYPQLARDSGMKYFFTQKLSWSQFNNFPHSTFNWAGLDGTQVITHMTPVDTYNARGSVGDVYKSVHAHKNLQATDLGLVPFGNGDGGGGALPEMLESLRRARSIANESGELPKVSMGRSVFDFFEQIEKETQHGEALPTWSGELYLELHRGTYTSHHDTKKGNRKSERLLEEVEFMATHASLLAGEKYTYPKKKIDELWELVLLCQFHDVLPGSAIAMVYKDVLQYHTYVIQEGKKLLEEAAEIIDKEWLGMGPTRLYGINTYLQPRKEIVEVPKETLEKYKNFVNRTFSGSDSPYNRSVQESSVGKQVGYINLASHATHYVATPKELPSNGATVTKLDDGTYVLQNSRIKVKVSSKGQITSVLSSVDGIDRELIPQGQYAGFTKYDDRPNNWDAWDVDEFHLQTETHIDADNVSVGELGPLRASVFATYNFGKSKISTEISLDAVNTNLGGSDSHLIQLDTKVDWHERHVFLKYSLPLTIKSDYATYETQFGNIARPTNRNTTWDRAKFEVCGHRFADLSEYGYGVALLNDCKYGHAVCGNVMRLSLLRSSTAPDSNQDQGQHTFKIGILPHKGHFMESNVVQIARAFNSPLLVKQGSEAPAEPICTDDKPPFNLSGSPNVLFECLKRGEDDFEPLNSKKSDKKTAIVRLYESMGGKGNAKVEINKPISKICQVDLLERELELEEAVVTKDDSKVTLVFKPYQVVSLKVVFE